MPGALLRTGTLREFRALGVDGQPVHGVALQLREAIRLKMQREAADCLAIPQSNEAGDRIDWYAPFEGDVVPWSAATAEERIQARARLEAMQARLRATGENMRDDVQNREKQVFGRLLEKGPVFSRCRPCLSGRRPAGGHLLGLHPAAGRPVARSSRLPAGRQARPGPPVADTVLPPPVTPAAAAAAAVAEKNPAGGAGCGCCSCRCSCCCCCSSCAPARRPSNCPSICRMSTCPACRPGKGSRKRSGCARRWWA
ncbi:SrfA family protein [Azotobacter vinelandii]